MTAGACASSPIPPLTLARRALTLATDIHGVLKLSDQYVRNIPDSSWGDVPASFRPSRIASREDLAHWAVRLTGCAQSGPTLEPRVFLLDALARMNHLWPRNGRSAHSGPAGAI